MTCRIQPAVCRGIALCGLLSLLAGCSGNTSVESFHPNEDIAFEALTDALTAWQNGQAEPGEIKDTQPIVQVSDSTWRSGAKLKSFEIAEELAGDSPSRFLVKLTLDGAAAPKEVKYVVVGKGPLWVFSEDEYNREGGM
ncbi:MAG TPA: hypothetical protein VGH74_11685 [Planctomycetaceae bacterium]|jgi:hypothetical protein